MKEKQDYIQDLAEIRQMMERSTKFLSLSGLSGVMAGVYALAGAYAAFRVFYFDRYEIIYNTLQNGEFSGGLLNIILIGLTVLVLAIGTAIFLSHKKAGKLNASIWNAASKQLLSNMAVPLVTGGVAVIVLLVKGFIGLAAPLTLIFYGLALFNAGRFTYNELRYLGIIEAVLGVLGLLFIGYGLLLWAVGFGVMHIAYGIFIYVRYER